MNRQERPLRDYSNRVIRCPSQTRAVPYRSQAAPESPSFAAMSAKRETCWPSGKPVEKILRVHSNIIRTAEEPRVTGDAAHAPRCGIMHHSTQHHAILILRGRNAVTPLHWWQIPGMPEA